MYELSRPNRLAPVTMHDRPGRLPESDGIVSAVHGQPATLSFANRSNSRQSVYERTLVATVDPLRRNTTRRTARRSRQRRRRIRTPPAVASTASTSTAARWDRSTRRSQQFSEHQNDHLPPICAPAGTARGDKVQPSTESGQNQFSTVIHIKLRHFNIDACPPILALVEPGRTKGSCPWKIERNPASASNLKVPQISNR